MFGYNDMNTYVPNPFAVDEMINMSGAGRKPKGKKVGWIQNEKIKTGRYIPPEVLEMMKNSKGKKELKELFVAGMDSDDEDMDCAGFFDEVKKGYSKAKKQLMDYQNGVRKTKPGKAAMAILEKSGVISKMRMNLKELVINLVKFQESRRLKNGVILVIIA